MIISVTTGISSTVKSAQSKKCRMLADVRSLKMNPKVAIAIRGVDPLLATVMSVADVENAVLGLKPSRGRGVGISIEVEV